MRTLKLVLSRIYHERYKDGLVEKGDSRGQDGYCGPKDRESLSIKKPR